MDQKYIRNILVVEDDPKISELLLNYLRADGLMAEAVYDGHAAVRHIQEHAPDAVILDWMLPVLDGIGVCKAVREFSDVPILMVTARVEEVDRILGLEIGADDYVVKPFSPREIVVRVRGLLRRKEGRMLTTQNQWIIDNSAFKISWHGQFLPLTRMEFIIFRTLLSRPGRVYSREQLLASANGTETDSSDRATDGHIKNLRKKILALNPELECITSVYGVGYRFDGDY